MARMPPEASPSMIRPVRNWRAMASPCGHEKARRVAGWVGQVGGLAVTAAQGPLVLNPDVGGGLVDLVDHAEQQSEKHRADGLADAGGPNGQVIAGGRLHP